MNIPEIINSRMNYFKLVVLIIGVIRYSNSNSALFSLVKNEDGTWNVTCDCLHEKEKELSVEIWSSTFPDDMYTLTIANCNKANILTGQHHIKRHFSELIVNNVDFCNVTRAKDKKIESSLPKRSYFTNVRSLTIDGPLYQTIRESEENFNDGILVFSNTTVENLIPRAIRLEKSSLKGLFMSEVHVKKASENAISFHGNYDSVLEIRNSFFNTIPNNFIECNVTNVKIWQNKFGNLRQGSFHLNSENIDFTGNTFDTVEGYAFNISPSSFGLIRDDDFKGIAVDETLPHVSLLQIIHNKLENVEEIALKLDSGYFANTSGGINMEKEGEKCYKPSKSKFLNESTKYAKMNERSFVFLLSKNIPLLWFLTIFFLILLFPVAYCIKIYLCNTIDTVFPAEVKHHPLINIDDS